VPWDDAERGHARRARARDRACERGSLYIELKSTPGTETGEIVEGLVVDLDEKEPLPASRQ